MIPFILIRVTAYGIGAILATLILGTISSRLIEFDEASTVLLFGLVIGVINAFIKPIVSLLTLPITCLTFGLFAVVINTVLFYFGASLTPGMDVGWWGAIFGSILTSLASGLMFSVVDE
ncbi:MAG: phage holin family protein [Chloroflexia bacterium]|nr:phage holin family protein [Chloroflexia bacterium]